MVAAPEATPGSPAAAVPWQQSCQLTVTSRQDRPAVNRFHAVGPHGSLRRRLVTGGLIITDQLG